MKSLTLAPPQQHQMNDHLKPLPTIQPNSQPANLYVTGPLRAIDGGLMAIETNVPWLDVLTPGAK